MNFVTCHDGFTLNDLVSYNNKHNERNGENNQDGANDNHSWNCGVEGKTDDPAVIALRKRLPRNFVCHLLFSSGTPMILGRRIPALAAGQQQRLLPGQRGDWFDWDQAARNGDTVEFFRKAIATRRYPILQRRKFFLGPISTPTRCRIWNGSAPISTP